MISGTYPSEDTGGLVDNMASDRFKSFWLGEDKDDTPKQRRKNLIQKLKEKGAKSIEEDVESGELDPATATVISVGRDTLIPDTPERAEELLLGATPVKHLKKIRYKKRPKKEPTPLNYEEINKDVIEQARERRKKLREGGGSINYQDVKDEVEMMTRRGKGEEGAAVLKYNKEPGNPATDIKYTPRQLTTEEFTERQARAKRLKDKRKNK